MKNSRDREKSRNDAIHRFTWGLWGEERGRLGPLIDRSSGEGQENGVCIIADGNGPESPFSPILFRQRLSKWVMPFEPPRYARSTKLHRAFPSLINFDLENSTHARKSQFSNFFREILLEDLEDRGRNELFWRDVSFSLFYISRHDSFVSSFSGEQFIIRKSWKLSGISRMLDKIFYPSYPLSRHPKKDEAIRRSRIRNAIMEISLPASPIYFTYSTDRRQREEVSIRGRD